MTFQEWLDMGIASGYCDEPVCQTHDGVHMTEEEEQQFEDGFDPCIAVIRLRDDESG